LEFLDKQKCCSFDVPPDSGGNKIGFGRGQNRLRLHDLLQKLVHSSSCNNHVTISLSCGVLEVLQHHLRPLSSCKAMKDGYFHGGNTGSNPVGDAKSFQRLTPIRSKTRGTSTVQVDFGRIILRAFLNCNGKLIKKKRQMCVDWVRRKSNDKF